MNNDIPLISIVLTTYNSEKIIKETLEAVVNQDFPLNTVELIIVDGGSKDNTLNIIKEFINNYVKYFYGMKLITHEKNYGVSKARNDGIKQAKGRFILILDHDVIMPKGTLSTLLHYIESSNRKVVAVIPLHNNTCKGIINTWEYVIRKGKIWKTNTITSCALVRRELFDEIGLYDESLGPPYTIYEDIELGARALSKGYEIHLLGTTEVIHDTCDGSSEIEISKKSKTSFLTLFHKGIEIIKRILNVRYIYALRKYVNSAPISEKIRWYSYSALLVLLIPAIICYVFGIIILPLIWGIATITLYFDVAHQYWNGKVPFISLIYAFTAYLWRLIRSYALLVSLISFNKLKIKYA